MLYRPSQRAMVTAAVMAGMFLSAIDTTAVATAMPRIVESLGGLTLYSWVFSIYMLASTATVPLFGYLSDLYGRKRLYLLGVFLFVGGSVLCSASTNMGQLILFRGIQGIGAGALMPITYAIVGDIYDLEERAKMQAFFSGVWGVSSVVGPLVGGLITDLWSWRAIFFMNLPIGVVAAVLIVVYLKENVPGKQGGGIDMLALASLTAGVAALLVGLQLGGRTYAWLSPQIIGLLMFSAAGIAVFLLRDLRSDRPVLHPSLMSDRIFQVASGAGVFGGAALFGLAAYVPLYVQGVHAGSATLSGASLTPMTFGWVAGSIVAGRLLLMVGYRPTATWGLAAFIGGTLMIAGSTASPSLTLLMAGMAVSGIGLGLSMTCFLIAVQNSAPPGLMGTATASVPFTRSIGGAIGVAAMGAVLLHSLGPEGLALSASGAASVAGPLSAAMFRVFLMASAFAAAALAIGVLLPRGRAQDLARR
jgi:EmrB/QacA subfamily drug resistance transporter